MNEGFELLAARIDAVADELARTLAPGAPGGGRMAALGAMVTTGAGGSEGPARMFAAAWQNRGKCAEFAPLSSFANEADLAALTPDRGLVVVSQGLCPNALIALAAIERFTRTFVVTALAPDLSAAENSPARLLAEAAERGATVISHGPVEERGLLVRVIGPAAAALALLALASETSPPPDLPARYRFALAAAADRIAALGAVLPTSSTPAAEQRVALLTAGNYSPFAHGLRWKLFEATGIADPPVWDVLQFAHGPFQQLYSRPMLLCALERPGDAPLFDRLAQLLVLGRHTLLRLPSALPPPWCWFEHDAAINALTLALLRARPIDLTRWPGQGADAAIYEWDGR